MEFGLPAAAVSHFNEQATGYCMRLRTVSPTSPRTVGVGESSEAHVPAKSFNQADVHDLRLTGSVDGLGRELSRCFRTSEGYVELAAEDYQSFLLLCRQLFDAGSLSDSLSEEFIRSTLFGWIEKHYKSEIPADLLFVEYLREQAGKAVGLRRVAIPLDSMSIEIPFTVGAVIYDYFRKDFFDSFQEFLLSQKKNDAEQVRLFVSRTRGEYQGRVHASFQVEAETERAIELAKVAVEESLMLLRFFSPTALLPEIPSYFGMLGRTSVPYIDAFVFTGTAGFPTIIKRVDEKRQFTLPLSSLHLGEMRKLGLDLAGALLTKPSRTELEELLLSSMSLVARATQAMLYHEKIVFTLAAAETLLLGDTAEPIQQSLGLRLAFLTSDQPDGRKAVIALVKDSYKCRSAYLHHGRQTGDLDTTKELQATVWTALHNVLMNLGKISSQSELLRFIEGMILS
jgi:hypothetical protein